MVTLDIGTSSNVLRPILRPLTSQGLKNIYSAGADPSFPSIFATSTYSKVQFNDSVGSTTRSITANTSSKSAYSRHGVPTTKSR